MTLKIIGTGTAAPHADKVGASLWVEHKSVRLLLDCGPAAVHGLARHDVPWSKTTHLAITHFHTDHIADIPYLLFALKHGTLPARRSCSAAYERFAGNATATDSATSRKSTAFE